MRATIRSSRPYVLSLIFLAVHAGSALASATTARADANPRASCVGIESSGPENRAESSHFVKQQYIDLGFSSPGAVWAFFAKLHEGSDFACFGD
jgi:hypothetical protein